MKFQFDDDPAWVFEEMFYTSLPCTGKHCAEHRPREKHVLSSRVKATGKSFKTRVPCKGEDCQICEAFRE